jgi:hypothetical protein
VFIEQVRVVDSRECDRERDANPKIIGEENEIENANATIVIEVSICRSSRYCQAKPIAKRREIENGYARISIPFRFQYVERIVDVTSQHVRIAALAIAISIQEVASQIGQLLPINR